MKIAIAITGASGSIYAKILLDKILLLKDIIKEVSLTYSSNAKTVWELEMGNNTYINYPFKVYRKEDFFAPFASGSAAYDAMIICPCSMGTLARIAQGTSNDLICRGADVMIKERKKLICVIRETPYNLIHLRNMVSLTEAGGIIFPASPPFYNKPENIEMAVSMVIDRILQQIGIQSPNAYQWGIEQI